MIFFKDITEVRGGENINQKMVDFVQVLFDEAKGGESIKTHIHTKVVER